MPLSQELVQRHGLTQEEFGKIVKLMGREPNLTELGIFSVMWSEHCSYKSSRVHLKTLPTEGPHVIEGPGENAGVVDIGNGLAAVFKIESHNHPSFIEPFQGAATGVGGIIRDIFTMGARPIANLNSLHFGSLENRRNQLIMEGVVAGIAAYGNCMGIPTVGGQVSFQDRYSRNPIVNAFCLGIARTDQIFRGQAAGPGNSVLYVGAKTGRDGIHGATMASEEFSEDSEAKRPTVQVGDPFMEKLLLEACLEAMQSGAVVGIQDMGAAGLTCSTTEMASRGGAGIHIELSLVPQREEGMTPYEIMLSESQERMLLVVRRGREEEVVSIFRRWDLDAVVVGEVREGASLEVDLDGERVAEIPNRLLTDEAPLYHRPYHKPDRTVQHPHWRDSDLAEPDDYQETLRSLLESAPLASRRWIYRQYDSTVRTNTVVYPGGDSAVLRIKGTRGGLAITLDGNSRFCQLDPREGARLAVAESCRNLVCSGARPIAATNCLNFASPENPEIMWQFVETVQGIGEACRFFGTPITGGNVSFYNETNGEGIFPTPVIGMVGKVDDMGAICRHGFQSEGDLIFLIGETRDDLGGSCYAELRTGTLLGPCPTLGLEVEARVQETVSTLIRLGLLQSAHDLSEGGLAVALTECCFSRKLGAEVEIISAMRSDLFLFSESPSRVLVSVAASDEEAFLEIARSSAIGLGRVGGRNLRLSGGGSTLIDTPVEALWKIWDRYFERTLGH